MDMTNWNDPRLIMLSPVKMFPQLVVMNSDDIAVMSFRIENHLGEVAWMVLTAKEVEKIHKCFQAFSGNSDEKVDLFMGMELTND